MRKILKSILFSFIWIAGFCQNSDTLPLNEQKARTAPGWITSGIIYQIQPRAFTVEGTLKAATDRLKKIAELGATIVYLCPVFVADDDLDEVFWSPRQKASGMNNPKNPYRMKDFYHVDPEYGTDEDLKEFITESHRLRLKVMLDMVYLHCGPTAVFLKEHPDFIKRNKDGKAINASWSFPALNFENAELREYLWKNMEYWVKEFDADGFRCDVADGVPLDFWKAARERLEVIKPDIGMLAEGERKEDQIMAFDLNYGFTWFNTLKAVYDGKKTVLDLRKTWNEMVKARPYGVRFIRFIDTHDIANDGWHNRIEKVWGFAGVNAALLMNFTLDGVPFLYNGQEIADTARHSIFGRAPINWVNAETFEGQSRFVFCQKLCKLRIAEKAFSSGKLKWLDNDQPQSILSYMRSLNDEHVLIIINLSNHPQHVRVLGLDGLKHKFVKVLMAEGVRKGNMESGFEFKEYGFWVGKIEIKE
ncbi:MAG: alpha-amylase family glycosyl hydrolase [Mangrovibacterium sp.]|nr:alpha-amylase family glycosyl hydrolase [Mangrovibacterium sp.]